MRFVQLFVFIILESFFVSFFHLVLDLPASLVVVGFHLYSFFDHTVLCHSIYVTKPAQSFGFNVIGYVFFLIKLINSSFVLIL
jgi:hypothetical protein